MEETINEKMIDLRKNEQSRHNKSELTIWSECFMRESNKNESIIRLIKGISFLVPHDGFFQANLYLTDKLVDEVCRLAASEKMETIIDAYCGSGLFSVFLSACADNVIGIEINEKSVKHARINAENAGVKNTQFISGDIEKVFQQRFRALGNRVDLIVLDPPRTGCEKTVLNAMVNLQPIKIIYISCNPATQARDVQYLNNYGYDLKSLLPLDMFPQTEHVEVIGYLELNKN